MQLRAGHSESRLLEVLLARDKDKLHINTRGEVTNENIQNE